MFDYHKFDSQCATMNTDELLQQHKHYTKISAGAMTSTAVSALSLPLTLGLSGVAMGISAPTHHIAKKKKLIVEKYLRERGIEAEVAEKMYQQEHDQHQHYQHQDQDMKCWMDQQQAMLPRGGHGKRNSYHGPSSTTPARPAPRRTSTVAPPSYEEALSQTSTRSSSPQSSASPLSSCVSPQSCGPQNGFCTPCSSLYPNSAMHPHHDDQRHVRFNEHVATIPI